MRLNWRFAAIIPLLGLLWAQDDTIFRSDSRLVVLHATAEDKDGRLVMDLPRSSFQVFENGVRQEIKSFRREDVPVSLGLIIDNSASMTDKRATVAAASLALVGSSNPEDEVFIVNFDEAPSLTVDFTSDITRLKKGLTGIKSRGGTAMRDALRTAIEHVKDRDKKDKKVLVVVTDGNDNSSMQPLDTVIRAAQQSDILIYAVGLLADETPREADKAKKALDALVRATGGQAYYPKDVSEINRIAPQIASEIRNQYIVTYSPTNQELDGSFRQIRLVVDSPGIANVRTRSGYYATPDRRPPVKRHESSD
ncbi:MAG TPA: VWA domain-containing protein [Bryobacteraceae bacterium]|nr:VWA domain-containing protein [Bryobacteraceae bacterium]